MARYCLLFALLLLLPAPGHSEDTGSARSAVAQELADCAAYYLLVSDLPGMQPETTAPIGEAAGVRAMQIARLYGNERLLQVRLHLALEHMKLNLDQNWLAIMDIRDRYTDRCSALLSAPENRLTYWLDNPE
jgi:hypothetical protein